MRTIKRQIVTGLIVSADGKLLLGKKDPESGGVYLDCWHLPGGGMRPGESHMQALRREMLEEVGIDIAMQSVKLFDDRGRGQSQKTLKSGEVVNCQMEFYVYRIELELPSGQVQAVPGDDLAELDWVAPAALKGRRLTPPSVELFERQTISLT